MTGLLELPVASRRTIVRIDSQVASDAEIAAVSCSMSIEQSLSEAPAPSLGRDIDVGFEERRIQAQPGVARRQKVGVKC